MIRPLKIAHDKIRNEDPVRNGNHYFRTGGCRDEFMEVSPYKVTDYYGYACYAIYKASWRDAAVKRLEILQ